MGPAVGPIYVVMLIVDIFFFAVLEWMIPREDIDYVPEECDWTIEHCDRLFRDNCEEIDKGS